MAPYRNTHVRLFAIPRFDERDDMTSQHITVFIVCRAPCVVRFGSEFERLCRCQGHLREADEITRPLRYDSSNHHEPNWSLTRLEASTTPGTHVRHEGEGWR